MKTSRKRRMQKTKLLSRPVEIAFGFTGNRNSGRHGRRFCYQLLPVSSAAALVWLAGCAGPHALRGGKAVTERSGPAGLEQTLVQGDNPAQQSRQTQATVRVRSYTLPAGARMENGFVRSSGDTSATNVYSFVLNQPIPVTEREETQAASELGAAQKDTARELSAKLASLGGITWLGVGLFCVGLASLVWPPLKLIIGSVTTSAALLAGGLALMILPTLVAGNELLILGAVGLTAGAWFLAHRHGHLRGQLATNIARTDSAASNTAAASEPQA
jgi:hypothetical protein